MQIIFKKEALSKFALKVISLMRENTLNGISADGSPFAAYSSKPFVMPAGAVTQKALKKLDKQGSIYWFKAKSSGNLWVLIQGGYKALREAKGRGLDVDLTDTGQMLRALIPVDFKENEIKIGFTNAEAAEKAYYHCVAGAGKGKTIRNFLGLPDYGWQEAVEYLDLTGARIIEN